MEDVLWSTVSNFLSISYCSVRTLTEMWRKPRDVQDGRFCEIRNVIRECFRMTERVVSINTISVI